jgi:hypothetical protein
MSRGSGSGNAIAPAIILQSLTIVQGPTMSASSVESRDAKRGGKGFLEPNPAPLALRHCRSLWDLVP